MGVEFLRRVSIRLTHVGRASALTRFNASFADVSKPRLRQLVTGGQARSVDASVRIYEWVQIVNDVAAGRPGAHSNLHFFAAVNAIAFQRFSKEELFRLGEAYGLPRSKALKEPLRMRVCAAVLASPQGMSCPSACR